jgi:Lytic transglycolase
VGTVGVWHGWRHTAGRTKRIPAKSPIIRADVRHPRVVALVALTAAIAAVAVPGPVGSRAPSPPIETDSDLFAQVEVAAGVQGPAMTIQPLDPGSRSAAALDEGSRLLEPAQRTKSPEGQTDRAQPKAKAGAIAKNTWKRDPEISWYGGDLFGNGTACGQRYTKTIVGVAHRTLPCGTKVQFRYNGKVVTVAVIDRGPYVADRQFDLSYGACRALNHCFTGPIEWRFPPG